MDAGTREHKELYDFKLHTGYIGTTALERFKSHLPGDCRPIPCSTLSLALFAVVVDNNPVDNSSVSCSL